MNNSLSLDWSSVPDATSREGLVPPLHKLTNHELVLLCQRGFSPDRAAFAELLRRHQVHIERLLYHLAPDWQDRSDLSQEVWIRVYRYVKRLKEPEKFRSWVSRIATNLFYDELRRRRRTQTPLSLDAPIQTSDGELDWELAAVAPGPDEHLATREFYEQLHEAITDLPEAFRATIMLREINGMAYEEIAETMGISVGTVKSRIARARRRLQLRLNAYMNNH
ncbi:MAG: sigma-70 family RNA polymerase sigma factor [Gemmatimonadaceae bacterium]|nr:sigma-70 family RNA polymerase sigma factor [Gloeobacterales cyanobacterium ES-bin-141]